MLTPVMIKTNAVDWSQLNDLRTLGEPELVAELLATFLEDSELQMASLVSAVQSGDAPRVKREALVLKGTAALLGAERLRATAEYLEAESALSVANVRPLIAALRTELSEVHSALAVNVPRC
jgi:HPt (histidine-containing phosphotransfer) domain-containing protein